MDVSIGIDVGWAPQRRSTGVVILDRNTKGVAVGSNPVVRTTADAIEFIAAELRRLKPRAATFCVDGPFAPAMPGAKVRLVERFLMSGPFASGAPPGCGLRLSPAPTSMKSTFLASTRVVLQDLVVAKHSIMDLSPSSVTGNVVEIFPTIFMAALLPPHEFTGERSKHTDDLWLELIGRRPLDGATRVCPAMVPYQPLVDAIEGCRHGELHDARAAAIAAIAADWFRAAPPGTTGPDAVMFIGHPVEYGFVLPPRSRCDPSFLAMTERHWRAADRDPLVWV